MFDPFLTTLSVAWILLAVGVISAVVFATAGSTGTTELPPQEAERSKRDQDVKPVARWSLVALSLLLASYGALRVQQDHDWLPFQRPHLFTWGIDAK